MRKPPVVRKRYRWWWLSLAAVPACCCGFPAFVFFDAVSYDPGPTLSPVSTFHFEGEILHADVEEHRLLLFHQAELQWRDLDSNRALARQACQGAPVHVQIARERPVMALLFPSGRIELRDARSLKPLRTFNVQQSANEYSRTYRIGLSSDGKLLAAFDDKLGLRLWNVAEGRHERVALEPNGSSTVDFSPDARWVLVGQNLGNLKLFAVSNLWKVYEAGSDVHITAFTPDGRYLFHDGVKGGLVRVDLKTFNADGPQGSTRLWGLEASRDSKRMAVTLPGSLLWTGGRGEVWQTEPLRLLSNIKFGDMPMPEVSLSPDGDRVAYGGSDGRLMVFRSSTGATLANLKGHRKDVDGVRFLTKDRLLSWSGQTVHIWNLARIQ